MTTFLLGIGHTGHYYNNIDDLRNNCPPNESPSKVLIFNKYNHHITTPPEDIGGKPFYDHILYAEKIYVINNKVFDEIEMKDMGIHVYEAYDQVIDDPIYFKMGERVIFIPTEKDGKSWATNIIHVERTPFLISEDFKFPAKIENNYVEKRGGMKVINIFFLIAVAQGPGHIYDGLFRAAKMKCLCFGNTKVSEIFNCIKTWAKVQDVMQYCYTTAVSYEDIAPNEPDPTCIKKTGKYFSDIRLPWLEIGSPNKTNPGQSIDPDKTVDENKITSKGLIYCEAYQPGNRLTSYPKSEKFKDDGLEWYEIILEIIS